MKQDWVGSLLRWGDSQHSGTSWLIVTTQTIKFIVPCLHKQGHLIFKGLHQVAQYHAAWQRAAGFQLGGFAWWEAVITGALPEVPLIVLPSTHGITWRSLHWWERESGGSSGHQPPFLPADLQVYPPIWRAGGQLANTLMPSQWETSLLTTSPIYWAQT